MTVPEKQPKWPEPSDTFTSRIGPLRVVLYIRVSTIEQAMEGWSLAAQEASMRAFAATKGWKVVGVFADEGKSARKRLKHRKEIFKMLDFVEAGNADIILFKELDRWFRSVSDFYTVQSRLDACGVTWVSERQPTLDMTTKEGRLQVNVLLSVGQNESDATSDRIKYTNKYLRSQRRWTGSARTLPRGYTTDENKHVVIDSEKEDYVRYLISAFMRCGSFRAALLETNDTFEERFHYNNGMRLITNPMLCGEYQGDPEFVEKPYMTREDFDYMQSLIRKNVRQNDNETYIFSGMVFCAKCKGTMAGSNTKKPVKKHGGEKTYKYYRCSKSAIQGDCSHKMRASEPKIEAQLMDFVRKAVAERIVEVKAVNQARAKRKPRKSNRAAIERQLDKLEDVYITSDRMTKERYEQKKAAILAKLVEDAPEPELPDLVSLEQIQELFSSDIEEVYKDYTGDERRLFWRSILTKVYVLEGKVVDVDFIE